MTNGKMGSLGVEEEFFDWRDSMNIRKCDFSAEG